MKLPRISLLALLGLVAILGPGVGFAVNRYRESVRILHRERLARDIEFLTDFKAHCDLSDKELVEYAIIIEKSPYLNRVEREELRKRVEHGLRSYRTYVADRQKRRHLIHPESSSSAEAAAGAGE